MFPAFPSKPKYLEPQLELLFAPENTTVNVGDTVVLTCEAAGTPEPRLQWFHDGNSLGEEEEDQMEYIIEGGDLTLLDVTEAYEGLFECVYDNDILEVSASAFLVVNPGK